MAFTTAELGDLGKPKALGLNIKRGPRHMQVPGRLGAHFFMAVRN